MIYAKFVESNNHIQGFSLTGHADAGPVGHDLVCAASSALAIGITNNLYRILSVAPTVQANETEGGFLELALPFEMSDKESEQAQILLEALYYSLLDIEQEHGKHIIVLKVKND